MSSTLSTDASAAASPLNVLNGYNTNSSSSPATSLRLHGGGPDRRDAEMHERIVRNLARQQQYQFHDAPHIDNPHPRPTEDRPMLTADAQAVYQQQLERLGIGHLAADTAPGREPSRPRQAFARYYQELMGSLRWSDSKRSSEESVDFDAMLETPFIRDNEDEDEPPPPISPAQRSAENTRESETRKEKRWFRRRGTSE